MSLADKVAIVTGGAQGIGLASATRLCDEGAKVILADTEEEAGKHAAEELGNAGCAARFISCNVSEKLDVMNLMAAVLEDHDRVDILINNAGIFDDANFLELDVAEFDRVIAVNLKGAFMVGQAVARQMVAQVEAGEAPGAIVNMASVNAVYALPDHVAYSVTKAGVQNLTKGMALALAKYSIRVNAIGPGSIMTPARAGLAENDEVRRRMLSRTPLGRIGRPEEIAAIAAFLVSEDASYITGETIYADGGRLALNYVVDVKE